MRLPVPSNFLTRKHFESSPEPTLESAQRRFAEAVLSSDLCTCTVYRCAVVREGGKKRWSK